MNDRSPAVDSSLMGSRALSHIWWIGQSALATAMYLAIHYLHVLNPGMKALTIYLVADLPLIALGIYDHRRSAQARRARRAQQDSDSRA